MSLRLFFSGKIPGNRSQKDGHDQLLRGGAAGGGTRMKGLNIDRSLIIKTNAIKFSVLDLLLVVLNLELILIKY
jgi:hypothetical protein